MGNRLMVGSWLKISGGSHSVLRYVANPNCRRSLKTAFISGVGTRHKVLYAWTKGSQDIQGPVTPALFLCLTGFTSFKAHSSDSERRLRQHNDPAYQLSKTTKRFRGPWKLLWARQCTDRGSAMKLEMSIKRRSIGRYLLELNRQSPTAGGINH